MKLNFKELAYWAFVRMPITFWGRYVKRNLVKVHWGRGLNNFGDCLQPDTLKYYGLTPVYVPSLAKADIIMAGSIMQLIPSDYKGYIIGTGGNHVSYDFPCAKIMATRGFLSRKCLPLHITNSCKLGDCGLLVKLVYNEPIEQKYYLGIVCHFVDLHNEAVALIARNYSDRVLIISPLDAPRNVVKKIKSCMHIVSSSLHGLIVADAFGIPSRRWVDRTTMEQTEYYEFKFNDYYSSLGIENNPIELKGDESPECLAQNTRIMPSERINMMVSDLDKAMKIFAKQMRH